MKKFTLQTTRHFSRGLARRVNMLMLGMLTLALTPAQEAGASAPAQAITLERVQGEGVQTKGGTWNETEGALRQSDVKAHDEGDAGAEKESTGESAANPPADSILLFGDEAWTTYSLSATVQIENPEHGAEAGLLAQARGTGNYIALTLRKHAHGALLRLRIENQGEISLVGDQAWFEGLDLGQPHQIQLDVAGNNAMGYLDGEPLVAYRFERQQPYSPEAADMWSEDPFNGRAGLITRDTAATFRDVKVESIANPARIIVPQAGVIGADGLIQPKESYDSLMHKMAEFMIRADSVIDKGKAPAALRGLPPYVLSVFIGSDDTLWALWSETAFNHALLIEACVGYYLYSGDARILEPAKRAADWHLANGTPETWALPHLPPSVVEFRPDGTWIGQDWGLELDKSAYFGLSLLKLYGATGDARYLERAQQIETTLGPLQQADGSWPFRVNAQTGEVKFGYACSQLWYAWFYNAMADVTGNDTLREKADRAVQWLIDHPVKTNQWVGLYGDVPSGVETFDQWVALETAMYLLERRERYPQAIEIARGIEAFVNEKLIEPYGLHPGVPGVVEQSEFRVVLAHHQLRLAEFYAVMYTATGDEAYRRRALETANSTTWLITSDGKVRLGFWFTAQCSIMPTPLQQFRRLMAHLPELAPQGEPHLLEETSLVKSVHYEGKALRYSTFGRSRDRISGAEGLHAELPDPADAKQRSFKPGVLELAHAGGEVRLQPDSTAVPQE